MRKIIFADIDGVLNSQKTMKKNNLDRLFYGRISNVNVEYAMKWQIVYIDFEKFELLKTIALSTSSEIVIISDWRGWRLWPLIEEELVRRGLPIVDVISREFSRFESIVRWLMENPWDDFLVIDDTRFNEYENILDHLVSPSTYDDGLTDYLAEDAIRLLGRAPLIKPHEKRLQLEADAYTIGSDPFTK